MNRKSFLQKVSIGILLVCTLSTCAQAGRSPIVEIGADDLSVQPDLDTQKRNILVLACDEQDSGDYAPVSIMVASVDTKSGDARMSVLPLGLLMNMPLIGRSTLNRAYIQGGERLAMKAVNEVYGLNIQDYVCIDLRRFSAVLDAVGEIRLCLNDEDAIALGLAAQQEVALDLDKVSTYMRLPRTDPTQDRVYDIVMQALTQGTRDKSLGKLMSMLQSVLGSIDTNIGLLDMANIGSKVMGSDVRMELHLPQAQTLIRVNDAMPYQYEADMDELLSELHTFIFAGLGGQKREY